MTERWEYQTERWEYQRGDLTMKEQQENEDAKQQHATREL
jgi:hypothetical protein